MESSCRPPPGSLPPSDRPLFLLDVSGSMQHDRRLELLKKVMSMLLGGKYAFVQFNVVAYSNTAEAWQPQMARGTPANLADARAWVRALEPRAATHMTAAFEVRSRGGGGCYVSHVRIVSRHR